MSRWTSRLAALGLVGALLATSGQTAVAASVNPLRTHVQKFEKQFLARHGITSQPTVSPTVIGGKTAPDGRWPGLVALLYAAQADNFLAQYCGGSLISPTHVLTAAHCTDFVTNAEVAVLVGTQHLDGTGTRIGVSSITVHPNWNADTMDFDVAVLTLSEPVTTIQPVKFITSEAEESLYAPVGGYSMAAGWGYTGSEWAHDVLQARLPLVDHASCTASYAAWDLNVTDQMMCAGTPVHRKAVCNGDSGSPLWVKNANSRYKLQVGVVSWGMTGCAQTKAPDVFSRLAVLGPWVQAQIAPTLK